MFKPLCASFPGIYWSEFGNLRGPPFGADRRHGVHSSQLLGSPRHWKFRDLIGGNSQLKF